MVTIYTVIIYVTLAQVATVFTYFDVNLGPGRTRANLVCILRNETCQLTNCPLRATLYIGQYVNVKNKISAIPSFKILPSSCG